MESRQNERNTTAMTSTILMVGVGSRVNVLLGTAITVMFLTASNLFLVNLRPAPVSSNLASSSSLNGGKNHSILFEQQEGQQTPDPIVVNDRAPETETFPPSNSKNATTITTAATIPPLTLTLEVPHLFHYSHEYVRSLSTTFSYWSREHNWRFLEKIGGPYQQANLMSMNETISKSSTTNTTNTHHGWCIPQTIRYNRARQLKSQPVTGMIFTKSPKAASSTGAAITIQIAHNVARRKFDELEHNPESLRLLPCASNYSHPFAFHRGVQRRAFPSIAFTNIRHPAKLALSMFYHFGVTRSGNDGTNDTSIIASAENLKSSQLGYIGGRGKGGKLNYDPQRIHQQVLDVYDFVAVVERMEESLVAMKILWHLEHEDIIVLNSKVAGSYSPVKDGSCEKIPKSVLTPALKDYFETNHTQDNIDYLLYAVVNMTLDRTIEETIGREIFERELRTHQRLKTLAQQDCPVEEYAPCTSHGERRQGVKCLEADMGCGHECVQRSVLRNKPAVVEQYYNS